LIDLNDIEMWHVFSTEKLMLMEKRDKRTIKLDFGIASNDACKEIVD